VFNGSWLLVGVVYAIAVWLARRAGMDLRWRVAGLFYVVVFIFLRDALIRDVVNLPADFLRILPPWSEITRDHRPINSEINDIILQIVPWAHQVRESWRSFELPLWNHMSGSGYPLLANAQSSALSVLRILSLPLSLGYAFAAEAAMKILMALTFTFLFCRRRGYSEIASIIGALCFGFCSFVIVWLHFPLVTVAVFLPAALLQIDLLVERRTFGRFAFAAALWACMLFGGHPETVAHIFFICLLYLLWILLVERPFNLREGIRFVLTLGGAMAVAGLLATPFLLPFAEALTKSKRYHELQVTPQGIGYYSDWPSFVVLLQPHFFGQVPFEKSWGPATAESITGFAGALGLGAWLTLLIHVVWTRRWRSREFFFVIATVIVLGIFMAWPGVAEAFHMIFRLAANARLRLLFAFLLAVMTAGAVDIAIAGLRAGATSFLLGIAFSAGILLYLVSTNPWEHPYRHDSGVIAVLPSMLVLLVATALPFAGRYQKLAAAVLTIVIVGELWGVSRGWNPNVPARMFYPTTPMLTALDAMRDQQTTPFRIVGIGPAFFPNLPAVYGYEDVRAHDPMANGRYLGVLRVLTGYDTADYFAKWVNLETSVLDFLNVRYLITHPKANLASYGKFALVYDGRDGKIYENVTVLPRIFPARNVILEFRDDAFARLLRTHADWAHTALLETLPVENDRMRNDLLAPRPTDSPNATLVIKWARPTDFRVTVDAPRYTFIVTSIPWWTGWKVEANGRRLNPLRVNGAFFGFTVPPGKTNVRVWYSPNSFTVGAIVALLTIVGLAVVRQRFATKRGRT
jgi:hypothetical protein